MRIVHLFAICALVFAAAYVYRIKMESTERTERVMCRMRSLGCTPCTGAIRSEADTLPKIIEEMIQFRRSERENRVIDHDQEGTMELKKREGYF